MLNGEAVIQLQVQHCWMQFKFSMRAVLYSAQRRSKDEWNMIARWSLWTEIIKELIQLVL